MPAIRVTPWARPRGLAEIGHCLYDTGAAAAIAAAGDEDEEAAIQAQIQTDQQLLERGCNFIDAYALRAALPHALASSGALARAILVDRSLFSASQPQSAHPPPASPSRNQTPNSTRQPSSAVLSPSSVIPTATALYATAFANFVTGFLDNRQVGASKRTMYDLAATIQMPASFVALRHQIVHEGYSSLPELRRASRRAMIWLWDAYWRDILLAEQVSLPVQGEDSDVEIDPTTKARALDDETFERVLDQWALSAENADYASVATNAGTTATYLLKTLATHDAKLRLDALVEELLTDTRMLRPISNLKSESAHLRHWNPLVHALSAQAGSSFTRSLARRLMQRLTSATASQAAKQTNLATPVDSPASPHLASEIRHCALAWLRHIVNKPEWVRLLRAHVPLRLFTRPCVHHPGPYSTTAGVILVKSRLWQAVYPETSTQMARRASRRSHAEEGVNKRRRTNNDDSDASVVALHEIIEAALEPETAIKPALDPETIVKAAQAVESDHDHEMDS